MKSTTQKINNVIGQLEGVKKMIDEKRTCIDILTQIKASSSALNALTTHFVEETMYTHIDTLCKKDTQEIHTLIKTLSR